MSARGAGREIAAGCSPVFCVRQVGEANIKQSTSRAPRGRTDASNPNFSVQSANPLIRLRPITTCSTTGRSLTAEAADLHHTSSAPARARARVQDPGGRVACEPGDRPARSTNSYRVREDLAAMRPIGMCPGEDRRRRSPACDIVHMKNKKLSGCDLQTERTRTRRARRANLPAR
jgi:hypothetical protein